MIKSIKRILTTLSFGALLVLPVLTLAPATVSAQDCFNDPDAGGIQACIDSGSCSTDPTGCDGEDSGDRANELIRLIINIFSAIVGVISVIMIIIGGAKYITSGGNDSNVAGAKNTIMYAIIGLIIVALAQVIVQFVLKKFTEV